MTGAQSGVLLLLACAALLPGVLLVIGGLTHLVHSRMLPDALANQRMIRPGAIRSVAFLVTIAELFMGSSVLLFALVAGSKSELRLSLLSVALLYLIYAIYSASLLRDGTASPCGCFSRSVAMSPAIFYRAVGCSFSAGVAAVAPWPAEIHALDGLTGIGLLLAVSVLAILLWTLPVALERPMKEIA